MMSKYTKIHVHEDPSSLALPLTATHSPPSPPPPPHSHHHFPLPCTHKHRKTSKITTVTFSKSYGRSAPAFKTYKECINSHRRLRVSISMTASPIAHPRPTKLSLKLKRQTNSDNPTSFSQKRAVLSSRIAPPKATPLQCRPHLLHPSHQTSATRLT